MKQEQSDSNQQENKPAVVDTPTGKTKKPVSSADKVKFIGLVIFFLLIVIISVFVAVVIVNMGTENLVAELEKAILEAGPFGILICLGIQLVQIVIAFIPGEAAQAAIGYVYGTVGGGFITLAGALIGSICVFYLVRKLGTPFVQGMIGDKDSGRFKFLHESKNLNALVFILYLIPGLPKDVFTYMVPLTDMRPSTFFVLSTIARSPAIFATTFVITAFRDGDYPAMAIVAIIFGGLGIIGIFFNQKVIALVNSLMKRVLPGDHGDVGEDVAEVEGVAEAEGIAGAEDAMEAGMTRPEKDDTRNRTGITKRETESVTPGGEETPDN